MRLLLLLLLLLDLAHSFEATCEKFVPQRVVTFMDVVPDDDFDLANEHADMSGSGVGGNNDDDDDDDDSVFSR